MSKRDLFAPFRAEYARDIAAHNGPRYWRSLEDKAQDEAVTSTLDVEFPSGTAPLGEMQRRDVLKLAGASLALAGLSSACIRRPEEEILPYTHQPPEVTPGLPTHFATVLPRATGAVGVVVTTYEGRPVKVEGNPLHPASLGAADVWAQAELIRVFDPDRARAPRKDSRTGHEPGKQHGAAATWADWDVFAKTHFAGFDGSGGKGLAFVTDGADKPTVARLLAKAQQKWNNAKIYRYDAANADRAIEGAELAYGAGSRVTYNLADAEVILAVDSDFLVTGTDALRLAKQFGARRRIKDKADAGRMSRLYAVEGTFTTTGASADHRLRLASSQLPAFLQAVGGALKAAGVDIGALPTGNAPAGSDKLVAAVAKDLAAKRGKGCILVGETQPAAAHAYAYALNAALGGQGTIQVVTTSADGPKGSTSASLQALVTDLEAGAVDTLVVLDVNLAHATPGALKVKDALKKAKTVISAGLIGDETAHATHWFLPLAHPLESWGDARAFDGTAGVVQPLILPIFGARSEVAILGGIIEGKTDDRALVEETWSAAGLTGVAWRKALHDGVITQSAGPGARTAVATPAAADAIATAMGAVKMPTGALEVALTFGPILDGRFGNSPWNQELPDFMTKLCWDNALVISPAKAAELSINSRVQRNGYTSDIVTLTVDGRSIEVPTFVFPGLAKDSAMLHLGYGRVAGGVATGVGTDAYPLMGKDGSRLVAGSVEKTKKQVQLASTQDHFNTPANQRKEVTFAEASALPAGTRERALLLSDGRQTHLREGKLKIYQESGATPWTKRRGNEKAPASEFAHEGDIPGNLVAHGTPTHKPSEPLQPTDPIVYDGQQWGMVIDLTACTGCNACVVACQAENNIVSVGREQVLLGREMHWMRIDRYFSGDVDNPVALHQPVNCMHCEQAPCESVCPVAATVHDEEGLNSMAYNRCIGTRYCSNNCPYKVRRYNYFDFSMSANVYRDPKKNARFDIYKLQRNPNVTVRYRGVMEKCTYCTQRIEAAKMAEKVKGGDRKKLPDGAVTPACAQTCPTEAITFGNVNDAASRVHALKQSDRNYELLQELNVRPRTTFLAKLRNTNPELEG